MKKVRPIVYISCPLAVDQKYLTEVAIKLHYLGYDYKYYNRGTKYSNIDLLSSDIVVVILPGRNFKLPWSAISTGVEKEIKKCAIKDGKPVYLAYWAAEGLKFYDTMIDDWGVSGIPGTSHFLVENHPVEEETSILQKDEKIYDDNLVDKFFNIEKKIPKNVTDYRLLLLL